MADPNRRRRRRWWWLRIFKSGKNTAARRSSWLSRVVGGTMPVRPRRRCFVISCRSVKLSRSVVKAIAPVGQPLPGAAVRLSLYMDCFDHLTWCQLIAPYLAMVSAPSCTAIMPSIMQLYFARNRQSRKNDNKQNIHNRREQHNTMASLFRHTVVNTDSK